jgi:UDP-glucose 4-epimerase
MKILFTGASSFTGLWFVKALCSASHTVTATLTKPVVAYQGLRRERVEQVASLATISERTTFGSREFLDLLRQGQFDLLCHHAAEVTNYNSIDFDATAAVANNTNNLRETLSEFKAAGGKGIVLTGSVFEADEGRDDGDTRPAFSAYGLSKAMTAQVFRHYTLLEGLALGKFVIPNPFGPWEEPRFTAYLMTSWKKGETAEVKTPDYVRDNVPIDLLAACYREFVGVTARRKGFVRANPSCYVETQGQFAQRFAREMRLRLDLPCALDLKTQTDFSQPLIRVNTDLATSLIPDWNEAASWDGVAAFYRRQQ